MKALLPLLLASLLMGAGCWSKKMEAPLSPTSTQDAVSPVRTNPVAPIMDPALCNDEPTEDDSGRMQYPIAPAYAALPHLGQIFTAFDCGDQDRAKLVAGMKDGVYQNGIRLRWQEGTPSADAKTVLKTLGFTEISETVWETKRTFSLDQLTLLKPLFVGPSAPKVTEDCIVCG